MIYFIFGPGLRTVYHLICGRVAFVYQAKLAVNATVYRSDLPRVCHSNRQKIRRLTVPRVSKVACIWSLLLSRKNADLHIREIATYQIVITGRDFRSITYPYSVNTYCCSS